MVGLRALGRSLGKMKHKKLRARSFPNLVSDIFGRVWPESELISKFARSCPRAADPDLTSEMGYPLFSNWSFVTKTEDLLPRLLLRADTHVTSNAL